MLETVGTGKGLVLRDGQYLAVTWSRSSADRRHDLHRRRRAGRGLRPGPGVGRAGEQEEPVKLIS